MKKITIFFTIFIISVANNVLADTINDLKSRLDKLDGFYAFFKQKIIDKDRNIIQESYGNIWMKRDNLFHWHVIHPDEVILVSDGKVLWFYIPYIEQVTITWLKDSVNETPFYSIISNQLKDLKRYNIKKDKNDFVLIPKSSNSNFKRFSINIDNNGIIQHLSILEQNDRCYNLDFRYQKKGKVDRDKFLFIPPKNVTVDDQRD